MTLQQAMMNIDADLPIWVQIAGDTVARFSIGFCIIILVVKVASIVLAPGLE